MASAALLLVAAFPAGCGEPPPPAVPLAPPPPSAASPVAPSVTAPEAQQAPEAPKAKRYAVASENETVSRVAMDVLAKGGSAADAAVAAILTEGIVQPVSSGIGGGGFAVVWDAKAKKISVLDFRETAPAKLRPNELLRRDKLPENKRGVLVGLPGEIAGLSEIHKRWGKLAFADVVRSAAEVADKGFSLSAHMERALKWNEGWVKKTPRYGLFAPSGTLARFKDLIKNPALAATLKRIAAEGKAAFYEGAIAADVIETATAAGSRMTAKELADYRVIDREPLRTTWEGYEVVTMPPPSAGGVMMLEALHMNKKADLTALAYDSGAYYHLLAEVFRGAVADRIRAIGDPAFVKTDVDALVSPARMAARRARISLTETIPAEKFPLKEEGTSHLVVVDGEGNVVTITSTVNNMFGSRLVTKGGFVLNDELDDFTREKVEKRFGIKGQGPNSPRPGARPVSSMTPTIVFEKGAPVFALGGSGGMRIATGTTQVLLARLAFGRSPAEAVSDPRIDTPPMGGLLLDASAPPEVVADLQKRGEVVDTSRGNYSAVQAIAIGEKDGVRVIEAASDPRKGGVALVE